MSSFYERLGNYLNYISCSNGYGRIEAPKDDLFEIFNAVHNPDEDSELLLFNKSNTMKSWIAYQFSDSNGVKVIVGYGEPVQKWYTICIVPTDREQEFGKLVQTAPLTANFFYNCLENGLQTLSSRLYEILPSKTKTHTILTKENMDIRDLCNFENALTSQAIWLGKSNITKHELDFMYENFNNAVLIVINSAGVWPEGMGTFPLKFPQAMIASSIPMKLEDLMTMETRYLSLLNSNFTSTDINKFIKLWLEKKIPEKFTWLEVYGTMISKTLLQDLDVIPWDCKRRAKTNYLPNCGIIDFETAFDVLRDDGMLASLKMFPGVCHFVVWKERFPDVSEVQEVVTIDMADFIQHLQF
ncbi:unnamed protein product [Caenorhabditis brenneri]